MDFKNFLLLNWGFTWAHWILTLLLAPLTDQVIQFIWGANSNQEVGFLSFGYPLVVIVSFVVSLPTLVVYLVSFFFLSKYKMPLFWAKIILIELSVAGIYITNTVLDGSMSKQIIIAYSVTSIVVGLCLPIRNKGDLLKVK